MEKETKVAAVSMKNITKTFGSVIANDKVNLDIYKGEILSLLGENGSGKTTLMNMLSGIYFPDEGQIFINGKEEVIKSPKDALRLGIGMVHQHFKLINVLSATENIILGLEGRLNIKEASRKIEEICDKYGFEVDPKQKIYDMTVSQKQTVEIVKVLYRGADILILAILLIQCILGLTTIPFSAQHPDGSEMMKLVGWAQSIVTFQGGASTHLDGVAFIFRVHLVLGMTIFLLFPFTRLVHVWSAPFEYFTRRYQIVRSRR